MASYSSDSEVYEDKPPSRPLTEYPTSSSEDEAEMADNIACMSMEEYTSQTRDDAGTQTPPDLLVLID